MKPPLTTAIQHALICAHARAIGHWLLAIGYWLAPVYELAWPFLRKLLSFRRLLADMAMP